MPAWKHQPALDDLAPVLHAWFQTELGKTVLAAEQRLIDRCLTDCFGYHLLQLGVDSDLTFFDDCRVQRCFKAGAALPTTSNRRQDGESVDAAFVQPAFVQCDAQELPFESDSLDVVIVHHALEFAANPHAVLRELYRVIVPEGRIVLVGFNPWSLLGGRMAMGRWRSNSIWRNHFLSVSRLHDWLELLGFATQHTDYGFHRLPLHQTAPWPAGTEHAWARHWPGGGVYAITAVKQVSKFIPLKPLRPRPRAALSPLAVVKPSTAVSPSALVNSSTAARSKQAGRR